MPSREAWASSGRKSRVPGASQLFPPASSLPWIAKGGTLNRPAEALVAIPDPGRHYSVPVGGIISLWWAASFRYGGRHHFVMMGGLDRNQHPRLSGRGRQVAAN